MKSRVERIPMLSMRRHRRTNHQRGKKSRGNQSASMRCSRSSVRPARAKTRFRCDRVLTMLLSRSSTQSATAAPSCECTFSLSTSTPPDATGPRGRSDSATAESRAFAAASPPPPLPFLRARAFLGERALPEHSHVDRVERDESPWADLPQNF